MNSSLRIIVTGLVAQHHTLAGVTWDYIQYAVGLRRLGHDVYYFEDSGEWPYNIDGGPAGNEWVASHCKKNTDHLNAVLKRYGMEDRWAYFFPTKSEWYGLSDRRRREVIQTADLLINVSGTIEKPEKYGSVERLAYIDSDPGFTQIKLIHQQEEFAKRIAAHDVHFSFGECMPEYLSQPTGYEWIPTRTPILLSEWRTGQAHRPAYTTVMNWTSYQPLILGDQVFGQKDTEFVRFLDLPGKIPEVELEVAMSKLQHKNWRSNIRQTITQQADASEETAFDSPAALLSHYGWKVVDPEICCGDFDSYRAYIEQSRAEWSVAKGGYVTGQAGWFSCRSACYLAAGRPVIVQNTGFEAAIPTGQGILTFNTTAEAEAAVHEVEGHYARHAQAARSAAEAYFDSDKVLNQLIEQVFTKQRMPVN